MKRKYKLVIIILISSIFTYLIYFFCKEDKLNIVALGDGIASGETSYGIDGISFNDYLKDYFESKNLLKNYSNNYTYKNYKISDLIDDLKSNVIDEEDNLYIKQLLHNADIITLCIGEEELIKLSITKDLTTENIKDMINNYDNLIFMLKDITEAKIVVVGFYENSYLNKTNTIILNSELSNIAIKYSLIYININDLMLNKEYNSDINNFYFNYKGHKVIADMIIHSL